MSKSIVAERLKGNIFKHMVESLGMYANQPSNGTTRIKYENYDGAGTAMVAVISKFNGFTLQTGARVDVRDHKKGIMHVWVNLMHSGRDLIAHNEGSINLSTPLLKIGALESYITDLLVRAVPEFKDSDTIRKHCLNPNGFGVADISTSFHKMAGGYGGASVALSFVNDAHHGRYSQITANVFTTGGECLSGNSVRLGLDTSCQEFGVEARALINSVVSRAEKTQKVFQF